MQQVYGRILFGIAQNDDQKQPEAKDVLKKAFASAPVPALVEVYPANHGWCVTDMPMQDGKPIYSQPEAERAWRMREDLYRTSLRT